MYRIVYVMYVQYCICNFISFNCTDCVFYKLIGLKMFYVINLFEFLLEMFNFGSNDPKKVVFGKSPCSSSVQITEPILT